MILDARSISLEPKRSSQLQIHLSLVLHEQLHNGLFSLQNLQQYLYPKDLEFVGRSIHNQFHSVQLISELETMVPFTEHLHIHDLSKSEHYVDLHRKDRDSTFWVQRISLGHCILLH